MSGKLKTCFKSLIFRLMLLFFLPVACTAQPTSDKQQADSIKTSDYEVVKIYSMLRDLMISEQISARGIKDQQVLAAMYRVERHRFVPDAYRDQAYGDHPLPIGEQQTISQPYIVALMTEGLELDSSSRVLEVGTGSGYQAAVLAEICDSVYTIEVIETLGQRAKVLLTDSLNYTNILLRIADGYQGWPEKSPFDAIIVTCSPTHIPQALQNQLVEGGRMIIPVGPSWNQELILLTKENGELTRQAIIPVRFVPMKNKKGDTY